MPIHTRIQHFLHKVADTEVNEFIHDNKKPPSIKDTTDVLFTTLETYIRKFSSIYIKQKQNYYILLYNVRNAVQLVYHHNLATKKKLHHNLQYIQPKVLLLVSQIGKCHL